MNRGVLCVGRVYCDLVFSGLPGLPAAGREVFAEGLRMSAGGGAFITAAYLAALDRPAALAAVLPAAPFDGLMRSELKRAGVDATFCEQAHGVEPQITVAMVEGDDRAFLTRRSGAALPDGIEAALAMPGLRHLHIGEATTLVERPDLIAAARRVGLTISLDCGWDAEVFAAAELANLIAAVDVFLPNEAEAQALAAHGIGPATAPLTVTKLGAAGAMARVDGQTVRCSARKSAVVDSTGAGDAFNAGFLQVWLDSGDIDDALRLGCECGAVAVARLGGATDLIRRDMPRQTDPADGGPSPARRLADL
ncbi:MAG: carbohydrate kinase [Limimaricola sp.]|uniref:carbohydrate kinase family protein n=1 Tax=Limimaricola sp. TaxID=2211665 RepID=UPI001DA838EC|nr:PfkB family carbohydrate kinase [Limimaricola sp.]MBI1416748.1 carbohydrate kinase [Limimaricola sp.]